jgi:16S rRNA pseudouridine516 synthase
MVIFMLLRLDKLIASTGVMTRTEVKEAVRCGRITVNDVPAMTAEKKCDPDNDKIAIDGEILSYSKFCYIMLNKPAGYVSATIDDNEKTVMELLPERYKKIGVFPSGRLDKDSEGLLILTNDGEFAHRMTSPRHHVKKVYYVKVEGELGDSDVDAFKKGVWLRDGTICREAELEILSRGEVSEAMVIISEGKYHQVKRMMASLGKKVIYLKRTKIGQLSLDESLEPGQWRMMPKSEVNRILSFTE